MLRATFINNSESSTKRAKFDVWANPPPYLRGMDPARRAQRFANANSGLIGRLVGVVTLLFDSNGQTLTGQINPFDRALRRPSDRLGAG